jgi:hypothetical protein
MWDSLLLDSEEIVILRYEKWMISEHIKDLETRLSMTCEFCGGYHGGLFCEEQFIVKEEQKVINVDYNSQLQTILDEFLMLNRVSFDKFEVQCGDLVEKVDECEKHLVEVEMKRHTIMVQAEHLKNKSTNIEEKPRVRRVELYLTMETQSMEMQENIHLQEETHSSLRWEVTILRSLLVGAWEHLLLCAKFMKFLPNKRKKKGDIFLLSFLPP